MSIFRTREEILSEAQEAFEESEFYFRGESPADRIANWHVWIRAWYTAVGLQPPPTKGKNESIS